ncbi:hypothetical protein PVL29_012257 [Vitis rotundifolia]|uniref:Uncharacterized protein n=1 Tax=Vitis rotundifolia TaxID=103349 RepID=A0AA38ZQH8_VITRO|nr:hypothetical protein PVL29_012257 [Vitis rotundifolia]
MKSIFFGLFFFILCAQALLSSGSESSFKLKNQDFNLSNRLAQRQDVQGVNQTFAGQLGESDDVTRYEKNENLVYSMKVKGKGAFGGANVVHRPRESRNTALRSVKPSLFVTAITACVTLGWFLGWSLASPF